MSRDKARIWTDEELARLERELHRAYSETYKDLNDNWTEYMKGYRKDAKPLYDALKKAELSGDRDAIRAAKKEYQAFLRQHTLQSRHYEIVRDNLAANLANIDQAAMSLINGHLPGIYAVNYNFLDSALPAGYAYGLITPETVTNLVLKELNFDKVITWNNGLMNTQVLQGILQGENMDKIAKRFQHVFNANYNEAIRNARTAVTYAENQGRLDSYYKAEKNGTVLVKVWHATHDSRTRHSHLAIDGDEAEIDEEFANGLQCPGDANGAAAEVYNCRCAMGTRIVGYRRSDGSILYV